MNEILVQKLVKTKKKRSSSQQSEWLFGPKVGEDEKTTEKKRFWPKISGFSVQIRMETNKMKKKRYSHQITGVMVLHHKMVPIQMVPPQDGDIRGGPPPPL